MDDENYSQAWHKLYEEHCHSWDEMSRRRFLNIPNDPEEVDQEEYEASKELVDEIESRQTG